MGKDNGRFALALQRLQNVQQKGIIPIFGWRCAILKTVKRIIIHIDPRRPRFVGKRGIGDGKIEPFQRSIRLYPMGSCQRVVSPQFSRGVIVQKHIHPRQRPGGVVHLLPVNRKPIGSFIRHLQQQRTRATSRVINSLILPRLLGNADYFSQHAGDFGRGVELPFALARFSSEVAHQVFVSVAQQVIPFGAVGAQV